MLKLDTLLQVGGVMHFGLLVASSLIPQTLRWRQELAKLEAMTRQLVWVHGAFIVMIIVAFGLLSILDAAELASGTKLARSICGFIAFFWLVRLGIQFFLFDAKPYLKNWLLTVGYHCLTVVFVCLVLIYGSATLAPY